MKFNIKKNGIYYTDVGLARKMISMLNIDYKSTFSLIEPAVGEGHILSLIVEKYFIENNEKSSGEKIKFLEKNIAAFDIREDAIVTCVEKLDEIAKRYVEGHIRWNVQRIDAVDKKKLMDAFNKYDYVISNPPYVSHRNMDENIIEKIKTISLFCNKYNFDLYYYFFEVGIELWNKKGKLVYISPNGYVKARSGEAMVKHLIDNSLIEAIIDFEDELKFEGASTYTAITILSINNTKLKIMDKHGNVKFLKRYVDLIHKYKYSIYSHEFLTEFDPNYITLGEIAEVRNGLATLQDKVFIINEADIINRTDNLLTIVKNEKIFEIEIDCIKKVIRSSDINKEIYVIFPYVEVFQPKRQYIKNLNLKSDFKNTNDYLINQLSSKYQENYGVFFGRKQGFNGYSEQKIVISKVAFLEKKPFKLVEEGFIMAGLSIKLKECYQQTNLIDILTYLNTEDVLAYLSVVSKNYASGFKSISSTDVKLIQIPRYIVKGEKHT